MMRVPGHRGFSLVELLLAIFILGLGLISIAALFPAGIILQQQAEDEFYGPVVAEHAMGVLRSRLEPDDFGTWWECMQAQAEVVQDAGGDGQQLLSETRFALAADNDNQLAAYLRLTDWPWLRPSVVVNPPTGQPDLLGAVDVFNHYGWATPGITVGEQTAYPDHPWRRFLAFDPEDPTQSVTGIPFDLTDNIVQGEVVPPRVLISADDRSWPPGDGSGARPRYFWDCAFRKVGDRVQAAIFVYRATASTLDAPAYRPGAVLADESGADAPAVPYRKQLEESQQWKPGQGTIDDALPTAGMLMDVNDVSTAWMHSGQWVMDQMGTVHRVVAGRDRRLSNDELLLSAPVPGPLVGAMFDREGEVGLFTASTALPPFTFDGLRKEDCQSGVLRDREFQPWPSVDHLFYLPSELPGLGSITYFIEPVFVGVKDL